MEKIGQKRTYRNKARELVNKPSVFFEKIFDPELIGIMNALTIADDKIRAELTGEKMGKHAPAPDDKISAKELIKNARSNFNRREYMAGISDLVIFNKKMFNTVELINEFKKSLSNIDETTLKHKLLFEGVSDTHLENIEKNIAHVRKNGEQCYESFIKEAKLAGLLDTWYNLTNARGRSLAAVEKRYPKITEDLRKKGLTVISNAESLLSNTISNLKTMATARATRKLDPYLEAANAIVADYSKFNDGEKGFTAYYDNVVLPTIKAKKELDEVNAKAQAEAKLKAEEEEKAKAVSQQPTSPAAILTPPPPSPLINPPPGPPGASSFPTPQPMLPQEAFLPSGYINPFVQTFSPTVQTAHIKKEPIIEQRRATPGGPKALEGVNIGKLPLSPPKKKVDTHQKFYESLQSLSDEHPIILANYIAKYAKSIQETDLETAVKLFNIVKNIRG